MISRQKKGQHANRAGGPEELRNGRSDLPLSSATPRWIVRVRDTFGCGRKRYQLASLGLTPGAEVKVCCNLGGPIVIEVRGSRLSLGRGVASKIMVQPVARVGDCECPADQVCPDEIED